MDNRKGEDLNETITKIRKDYEKVAQKNREETEAWYQSKVGLTGEDAWLLYEYSPLSYEVNYELWTMDYELCLFDSLTT